MNLKDLIYISEGQELHTIDSDGNYALEFPFYAAYLPSDVALYRDKFPPEIRERYGDIPIYDVVTRARRNLLIAPRGASLARFAQMLFDDKIIRAQILIILEEFFASFDQLDRELNGREVMVYNLLQEAISPGGSIEKLYDAFVVSMELDDPPYKIPYGQYGINLMALGYSGILDVADMEYNTYKAEKPVIFLDPTSIEIVRIEKIGGPR